MNCNNKGWVCLTLYTSQLRFKFKGSTASSTHIPSLRGGGRKLFDANSSSSICIPSNEIYVYLGGAGKGSYFCDLT